MARELITKPIIVGDHWFVQEPSGNAYLVGKKCKICKRVYFPKRGVCPSCVKDGTLEDIKLSTRGKLRNFVVSQVAASGFKAPYIIGYVHLPEVTGIFSTIVGFEPKEGSVKMGTPVELQIGKIAEDEFGNDIIGYMFSRVKEGKETK